MRRKLRGIVVSVTILVLTVLSGACGGRSPSPLSPTPATSNNVSPSPTGATVNGSVRLGATAQDVGSAADPMKVEVVGASIVAVVSTAGQFALGSVPPGDVKLHFYGAGVDACVTISGVGTGETVTISVTVVGTAAAIESQVRQGSTEEQIDGKIDSIDPAAGTLVVSGRTVRTDGSTVIKDGSVVRGFGDLAIGLRVHVKGRTSGGTFTATLIEIQSVQTDTPLNVSGTVEGLTGSELAFQFKIGSQVIKGDHQTQFLGNGGTKVSFTDLTNGRLVAVKGQQQTGAIYALKLTITTEQPTYFEFYGEIGGLSGTCPQLTFTVKGKTVTTNASTEFSKSGCSAVRNGLLVSIKGLKYSDGSVVANRALLDVDEETPFEASGTVSSLGGSCPGVGFTLTVTGCIGLSFTVSTTASTTFANVTCGGMTNGMTVYVRGTQNSAGVITASRVERK